MKIFNHIRSYRVFYLLELVQSNSKIKASVTKIGKITNLCNVRPDNIVLSQVRIKSCFPEYNTNTPMLVILKWYAGSLSTQEV